jgi:hypothetical protein
MSDEVATETQEVLEHVENTEKGEEETPLKTPKKKFVMTPARMETLRKGREKRMQNISKKKEIIENLKTEEKQKKEAIKKRVEAELAKQEEESARESHVPCDDARHCKPQRCESSESDSSSEEESAHGSHVPCDDARHCKPQRCELPPPKKKERKPRGKATTPNNSPNSTGQRFLVFI